MPQLCVQYRMPEALSDIVSGAFYDQTLETCAAKFGQSGMRTVEAEGVPTRPDRGHGQVNPREAQQAVSEARRLLDVERLDRVAILTFYKAQLHRIQDILKKGPDPRIEVLSVDAAQGHEFPGVVLSCVASGRRVGFTNNPNRLCVALSRAQQRLTVVAQASLMERIRPLGRVRDAARGDECIASHVSKLSIA